MTAAASPTTSPIVAVVFNRPEVTAGLFDILRAAQPRTMLVVADGPRPGVADDVARCTATRAVVREAIDWPCDLRLDFADEHLGCRRRVVSGLDWAFAQFDRAIVLEDDNHPDHSFFGFCDTVLERYASDDRIGHIAGRNPIGAWREGELDYCFAPTTPTQGWATWRRAWVDYDVTLDHYRDDATRAAIAEVAVDERHRAFLQWMLDDDVPNQTGDWDGQWQLAQLAHHRVSVIPTRNLVTNVGFGEDATHTFNTDDLMGLLRAESVGVPPHGPTDVFADRELERRAVQAERLRSIRDARFTARMAQHLTDPATAPGVPVNPAVAHAYAAFDDPELCVDVLRRLLAHSAASEHLVRLEREFTALVEAGDRA